MSLENIIKLLYLLPTSQQNYPKNYFYFTCATVCKIFFRHPLVHKNAYFGHGSRDIWIDKVNCRGNEINFNDCVGTYVETYYIQAKYYTQTWFVRHSHYRQVSRHRVSPEWGHHDCTHDEDVSITCSKFTFK